jgi:endo-1,4-beta-xylanase
MTKIFQKAGIAFFAVSLIVASACKKTVDNPTTGTTPTTPTTIPADATLKSSSSAYFPVMGMALTYNFAQMTEVMAILKREVNTITFGNELKEESIVKGSAGVYDYSTADAFYNLATANGLQVTGHNLVWYSQQNATYLNGLINPVTVTPSSTNLVTNGTFEAGSDAATGDIFTGWQDLNHSNGTFSVATGTAVYAGSQALQATVTTAAQAYNTQLLMRTPIPVTKGSTYNISFWIKGSVATTAQFEIRSSDATVVYQGGQPVTTGWTQINYSYIATGTTMQLAFDLGANVGTYFIDNVSAFATTTSSTTTLTAAQKSVIIDSAMKKYIVNTVKHYSGKIKTWDVVNEPFTDNGRLRTEKSYTIPLAKANNQFLYAQYVGSNAYDQNNYVLKAYQYTKAADPTVTTFINDYNLEFKAKVDSMKALITFINKNGALIDGVGTQMHITLATSLSGIDYAFKTLASTGLKVRISELDIALNPTETAGYIPDAAALSNQAAMYKYVVQSYIKNVPAAQRYGITIWGVTDTDSWLNTATAPDYPLLFDKSYAKKPAYTGFLQGLQ